MSNNPVQKKGKEEEKKQELEQPKEEKTTNETIFEELNQKINQLEKKEELWKYKCAELVNELEMNKNRASELLKYGQQRLLERILFFLDGFEKTLETAENTINDPVEKKKKVTVFLEAFRLSVDEFEKILKEHGVEKILVKEKEELFDPQKHKAINFETNDQYPANTVLKILQNGYTLHQRILRPVWVSISVTKKQN